MTTAQQIITILLLALGVMSTRFISFMLFISEKRTPPFVNYLSRYLPSAVFGILVVYSLKDVDITSATHGLPELLGILACILLHLWRRNMLLTIAGGTIFYMTLIYFIA